MSKQALRNRLITQSLSGSFRLFLVTGVLLTLAGGALFVYALVSGNADRAWHLFQANWLFFTGVTFGSIALVAVHKIANAKWSGVIIRFSEATIGFAVVSLLGLIVIFTAGYDHLYGPMQEQLHAFSRGKALWLSHGFMFGRLFVALLILALIGRALVWADLVPDLSLVKGAATGARKAVYDRMTAGFDPSIAGRLAHDKEIHRLAPIFIVVYALAMTIVAFDGIMALQPHWFSNLLGGFYFMGSFLAGHTALALFLLYGRNELGIPDLVSPKQRHDLGKLIFGFTIFWAYLMWAQFLVIWYGNMPEETGFVFARLWGPWMPIGRAVLIGMFIVPFWGLLFVAMKKSPFMLGLFSAISLVSLWLERYLLVLPSVTKESGPVFGLAELGPTAMFLGLFLLCYWA
ncbi:MAG: hypothetical protein ABI647_27010, partial [Gemmatimonadota bacterium]